MACIILFLQFLSEFPAKQKWVKTHTPRSVMYCWVSNCHKFTCFQSCHSEVHDRAVNTLLVGAQGWKKLQPPSQEERRAQAETPKLQSVAEHHSRKDHASSAGVGFLRHLKYPARVISSDLNQTSLCTQLSTMVTCFLIHLQSTAFLRWIHSLARSNPPPCASCHSVQESLSQIDPRVVSVLLWDCRLAGGMTEKWRAKLEGNVFSLAGTSQASHLPKKRADFNPTVFIFVWTEKNGQCICYNMLISLSAPVVG